tara:strand:+ start:23 stop:700 length:678 start_codon:yes stop_codon:yes gene_type:complete
MTGKFELKFKLAVIAVAGILGLSAGNAFANCDGFMEEFETTSLGISYKKDPETGAIRAFLMSGEANFLAPKSSLVRKAKKKAFMRAKAEFTRFMKEEFVAADLVSDLTNSIETTDQDGNTSGTVEEMSSMVETMGSATESVLSGIVVLGECVDKTEKIAIVLAGWKPELSAAAADAKQTIKKEVARGDAPVSSSGNNSSGGGNKSTSKINEVKSYSKKSSIAKDF